MKQTISIKTKNKSNLSNPVDFKSVQNSTQAIKNIILEKNFNCDNFSQCIEVINKYLSKSNNKLLNDMFKSLFIKNNKSIFEKDNILNTSFDQKTVTDLIIAMNKNKDKFTIDSSNNNKILSGFYF